MLTFDGKKNPERRQRLEAGDRIGLTADGPHHNEMVSIVPDFAEYRKTATTFAVRMEEPFEVDTLEGLHSAKAGDWLAMGAAGELYPIDAAVFAATYEKVE